MSIITITNMINNSTNDIYEYYFNIIQERKVQSWRKIKIENT